MLVPLAIFTPLLGTTTMARSGLALTFFAIALCIGVATTVFAAVTPARLRALLLLFAFFGLGVCLDFASQGAGRVGGAIAAQGVRLSIVVLGGLALMTMGAPLWTVFLLSAAAMVPMGLGTALFIKLARW